jgi:phosphoribosylaminoimidazole-succinocarboxamide synthase
VPPKLKTKERRANQVKAEATTIVVGLDSPQRAKIESILKQVEKEAKRIAKERGVAISDVNLETVSLKAKNRKTQ